MTPLMREKIIEYLMYYWLTLAQESLNQDNRDIVKWAFTAVSVLKWVFEWLKLKQPKKEEPKPI